MSKGGLKGPIQIKPGVSCGDELINKMLRLVKEGFHHFEQVLEIMQARGIEYQNLRAGRYAREQMRHVRTYEPLTLIDRLIVGAFIEARSCERFAALAPYTNLYRD